VREVVTRSLPPTVYEPHVSEATEFAYARFRALLDSSDTI
jgi:hypothetical protein